MLKPPTQIEGRPNFSSLADEAPSEVRFTPPIPHGSYAAAVQPGWRRDKNQKTGTDFHEFQFKLMEAYEDVDADELAQWIAENGSISERLYKRQFFMTHDAVPFLDEFHEACGLDLAQLAKTKVSRLSRNDMVANAYVGVYIRHKPYNDNSGKVQPVIDRFFKLIDG